MFREIFDIYNWEEIKQSIYSKTSDDVEMVLNKSNRRTPEDFKALVSPAAIGYIEQMAQLSRELTLKRFGKNMQMYIPVYLSNECQNSCVYCGFSRNNNIKRITLSEEQIVQEIKEIKKFGFEHILIVTGENELKAGIEYFKKVLPLFKSEFAHVSMEIQPMMQSEYEQLIPLGLNTVLVYQETYNKNLYKNYHPSGKKSDFYFRLETPDRLGKANINKMGIGFLIGLDDWRTEAFFTSLHLNYLEKNYWKTKYSISFPRLRPAAGEFEPKVNITDKELVQLICAYRIFKEEVELSISTRESEVFRDNLIKLGITNISAGSKTNPGGYSTFKESLKQFEINDERSPEEIGEIIKHQGYEVVWKDWEKTYN
ncbi:MAG: 2-iminoacetate synthase ThiH [Bacteroidales bacterium]|nr:2-iminoacetate synthase ThiH [Bacteroidales bacterium]